MQFLTLEREARTDFVGSDFRSDIVQPLGVKSKTKGGTDAGTESLGVACCRSGVSVRLMRI